MSTTVKRCLVSKKGKIDDAMEENEYLITRDSGEVASSMIDNDVRKKKFRWSNAIELPTFLIIFGAMLADAPITNMLMYRTCVHSLEYPVDKCRAFLQPGRTNSTQDIEAEVQKYVTFVSTVKTVLESLLPAVLSLFMVAWSDKHGRKPLMVWPMLGMTLTSMMVIVYSIWDNLGPWWILASSVPYALSGGFSLLAVASLCYATDVSDKNTRSMRILTIQGTFGAGMALGTMTSPYLLKLVGTVYLFLVVCSFFTAAYALTIIWIEEPIQNVVPGNIFSVLDFSLVKKLFQECFKRRPNNLRAQTLLVITANTIDAFINCGLMGLNYYFMRQVLHWSLEDYTQYMSVSIAIGFLGSYLGIGVIQRIFSVGDMVFIIIAFVSSAARYYIKGFAVTGWEMYLSSAVALFGNLSQPLTRSFVSKILPEQDVAKVIALMGAIEAVCPLIAPMTFNAIYAVTLSTFPGAIMVIAGVVNIISVIIYGFIAYFRWKVTSSYEHRRVET